MRLAAPSTATALTFVSNAVSGNTATIRLSALANSAGGFTVSLGTSSTTATGVGPALLAEDGAIVPYQVSFGGKAVDLSRGEQQLVSITRDTTVNDGEDLQVVTPNSINTSGKRLTDHLILTIKAR